MKHLYNVDIDRIYMTGHSMGGFGTWALGPKMAEDLAAISPMAGGGRGGIARLVKTRTLQGTDLDFVYTELPGKGDPRVLDRTVVKRVLAPAHDVATSERVPQDPSEARTALADDEKARAAAEAVRR